MIRRTTQEQEQFLLSRPESGMGYQIVEFRNELYGALQRAVAYNAQLVIDRDDEFDKFKHEVVGTGFSRLLVNAEMTRSMSGVRDLSVVPHEGRSSSSMVAEPFESKCGRRSGGVGASGEPETKADGKEIFVRLSAYADDKRVDLKRKRLLPGSYATTAEDYRLCVKCPDDPIDRYALPNPDPITTAFHVQPAQGDVLQRGTVQPNFGHDGGGAEALFKDGTSDGSLIGIKPYGQ